MSLTRYGRREILLACVAYAALAGAALLAGPYAEIGRAHV